MLETNSNVIIVTRCSTTTLWWSFTNAFILEKRPYKCLECGDGFSCTSSLKSHYKLHEQQSLYEYEKDDFVTNLTFYQKYEVNAKYNNNEWSGYEQSYSGEFDK